MNRRLPARRARHLIRPDQARRVRRDPHVLGVPRLERGEPLEQGGAGPAPACGSPLHPHQRHRVPVLAPAHPEHRSGDVWLPPGVLQRPDRLQVPRVHAAELSAGMVDLEARRGWSVGVAEDLLEDVRVVRAGARRPLPDPAAPLPANDRGRRPVRVRAPRPLGAPGSTRRCRPRDDGGPARRAGRRPRSGRSDRRTVGCDSRRCGTPAARTSSEGPRRTRPGCHTGRSLGRHGGVGRVWRVTTAARPVDRELRPPR